MAGQALQDVIAPKASDDIGLVGAPEVVIARGASARGTVLRAERRKSFGRQGKLDFSIDCVETVDGQNVRLRYQREMRGKSRHATAGVVTYLTGPFGFFVKGRDTEIRAGTEYSIFIDGERTVRLSG